MSDTATPSTIIIGGGPSGIALAYELKHKLGYTDFIIYERNDGVGGTWKTNTYPGCGCDIPSHLYSFSFNPNPNWSIELCEQPEILQYMNDTVDKFELRPFFHLGIECLGGKWHEDRNEWEVFLKDHKTDMTYSRFATILISAVGALSTPKTPNFPGMDKFRGPMVHTAQWDHSLNWEGKKVAVIGNGCSSAQAIPVMAEKAAKITQYARSRQWYLPRPNHVFTETEKWSFRWIPLLQKWLRFRIFLDADADTKEYYSSTTGVKSRSRLERKAEAYMLSKTPKKYHSFIIPDFPLGCKRRIFDPGYLDSLNRRNVELINQGIKEFTETGLVDTAGKAADFDIIVLATGYQVTDFLQTIKIEGANGVSLAQQWRECRGAQAYMGTYVHNFPNFGIIYGPNTFPANNSALFSCQTQVNYAVRSLIRPIVDGRASRIEVKQSAEDRETNVIHAKLKSSVFFSGCSSWFINEHGRNVTSWPGKAEEYWRRTLAVDWGAFKLRGGTRWWALNALLREVSPRIHAERDMVLLAVVAAFVKSRQLTQIVQPHIKWAGEMVLQNATELLHR
ncbi:hypothetical protein AYO21_02673 [Fonsecaea monophora]|uniref:Monooxygenase n=1 Tax=Fonsecaea monophora TaxID=254056 RepID=A0A177FFI0_9EURO|nr:hypothetical protein AYO21_02673 [Fonsecaea monophora]OAG43054.1 hypothetical protein AYO21_02673 [Fonsecaea monophora]